MNDQSKMCDQTTFADTPNATSLQASGSGRTPCETPDGATTAPSGLEVALASLSPRQAKEMGLLTSGTCGPLGITSSASASLTSSLVSRLKRRSDILGSTLFKLTWKEVATPLGWSVSLLRASVRRTSDNDCSSWPTPLTFDSSNNGTPRPLRYKGAAPSEAGNTRNPDSPGSYRGDLKDWAALASWPTTTTRDWKDGGNPDVNVPLNALLGRVVWLSGWPTTTVTDAARGEKYDPFAKNMTLNMAAARSGWPTPQARDHFPSHSQEYVEQKKAEGHGMANLNDLVTLTGPARLTATGEMLIGSSAGMESGGQLNPAHSRWLMGLPPEWDEAAPVKNPTPRYRARTKATE